MVPVDYTRRAPTSREGHQPPTGKISYTRRPTSSSRPVGVDVAQRAPGLVSLHKEAGVSLVKNNLAGVRAAVYLVLDHSGSMHRFYRNGTVQTFTERVLAAAAHLDDDGVVPVILFDSTARAPVDVSIDSYEGAIDRLKDSAGHMGTTNYADAMSAVIEHHRLSGTSEPALVVFETDGSPDSRSKAQKTLCDAASLPIFWQFVGFG